jgi:hypothetical protein
VNMPVPKWTASLNGSMKGKKIGIPKEYRVDGIPAEIDALWTKGAQWLKDQGAEIVEVSLPHTKYALATYYIVAPAECSSNLARYDGVRFGLRVDNGGSLIDMYKATRAAGFGKEVRRRIMIGTYVLSAGYYDAYYNKARRVRARIAEDFAKAFEQCDALLTPTAPSTAFVVGANEDDPVKMYLNDIFTIPASLAGLPGMSVPAGLGSDGLPLGLQIIGKAFDEQTVLDVGLAIEQARPVQRPAQLHGGLKRVGQARSMGFENTIIALIGFPGVGKYTIAKELARLMPAMVVDNHYCNNVIFPLAGHGWGDRCADQVWDQIDKVRQVVMETIATISPSEASFIFTGVLRDTDDSDFATYQLWASTAAQRKALFVPVVLACEAAENQRRVVSEGRAERMKLTKPEMIAHIHATEQLLTPTHAHCLQLETTHLSVEQTVAQIMSHVEALNHANA